MTATVTLDSLPVAQNDTGSVNENDTLSVSAVNGLITSTLVAGGKDSDVDGDILSITAIRTGAESGSGTDGTIDNALAGTYGHLTLHANGSYGYVADTAAALALTAGATATDTFTYTVSDGHGETDTAELTITVTGKESATTTNLEAISHTLESTGLRGEYFGYNQTSDELGGTTYQSHNNDNNYENIDSIAEAANIIKDRNNSAIFGTAVASADNAVDAKWQVKTYDYGSGSTPDTNRWFGDNLGYNGNGLANDTAITSGNLYKFLGGTLSTDAGSLKTSTQTSNNTFGITTDAVYRTTGMIYIIAGTYDMRVREDDGFRILIDGQNIGEIDRINSATTYVYRSITLTTGFHTFETIGWDKGGEAQSKIEFKLHDQPDSAYVTLSTSNFLMVDPSVSTSLAWQDTIVQSGSTFTQWTGASGNGTASNETINGTLYNDAINGGEGNDIINADAGDDRIDERGVLGSGADIINLGTGNDTLYAGNETVVGNDSYNGGAGNDTLDYSAATGSITMYDVAVGGNSTTGMFEDPINGGASGVAIGGTTMGTDTFSSFEYFILGNWDDTINFTGLLTGITVDGGAGADTIHGGSGNDTIHGGSGGDNLDGGGGVNTLSYATDTTGVTLNLATNTASGGDAASDVIANFQNVIGGAGSDVLTALATGSTIIGGAGTDTITGGAGNDIADERSDNGIGNDTVTLGDGKDTLYAGGEIGAPSVIYYNSGDWNASTATLDHTPSNYNSTNTYTGGNNQDTLDFSGAKYDIAIYNSANNALGLSTDGSGTAFGSDIGEVHFSGFELFVMGNGNDSLKAYDSSNGVSMRGGWGNDFLSGSNAATGNDYIDGESGADMLAGKSGNDTIVLDISDQKISGGEGIDTFLVQESINFDNLAAGVIEKMNGLDLDGTATIDITGLSLDSIFNMSDDGITGSTNNHIFNIFGDTGNTVTRLYTGGWTLDTGQSTYNTAGGSWSVTNQDLTTTTKTATYDHLVYTSGSNTLTLNLGGSVSASDSTHLTYTLA